MATNPGTGPDETERLEPGNAGGSNPAGTTVPGGEQEDSSSETDEPGFDDADLPENGKGSSDSLEEEPLPEDEDGANIGEAQEQAAQEREESGYQ